MSNEILPIAVDALGGDHAPEQVVAGAADSGLPVILVGPGGVLEPLVEKAGSPPELQVEHASEAVGMDEHPYQAVRNKKDSSMLVAIRLVKDGRASGVMSAGNTGAFVVGATSVLGRLAEVKRPGIAIGLPAPEGQTLMLDAGAAADCTSEDLVDYAVMGDAYARLIWHLEAPRIGLLSIGEEESKGSKQARQAHQLLKASDLNFIGNVQGSDVGSMVTDVIVTDGFTGNVALKMGEGVAALIMNVVKDELRATRGVQRLAALVLRPLLRRVKKRLDWQEYGGGALLGVTGNVVISHGKSKKRPIASAIKLAWELARTDLLHELERALRKHHELAEGGEAEPDGSEAAEMAG